MDLADGSALVVAELRRRYPRFPGPTIERLVHRVATELGAPVPALSRLWYFSEVQLRYLDEEGGPIAGTSRRRER